MEGLTDHGYCGLDDIRGSIPAKVGYWEGLRMFSYVPTPLNLLTKIQKTKLSGPKKGGFSPKIPQRCPLFRFWHVLAVFSRFKPAERALHHFFVSLMLHLSDKKLPQEFGKKNLTLSLTKSASIGYFTAFFAFISRYVMQKNLKAISEINNLIKRSYQGPIKKFQWNIALLANNVDFFATHRFGMNST